MKRFRNEDGSAAVEFALLAPLLLALLALVIAVGRVITIRSAVESISREAARSASAAQTAEAALNTAQARADQVAGELELDPARLDLETNIGEFTRGSPIEIRATYKVLLDDLPAFGLFPGSFDVSARHLEIVERFKSR
jgi:Flp pilus assembly pilin Flp